MKNICEVCNKEIEENFSFCPYCSNALTKEAEKLEKQKMINSQLVLLYNLISQINDAESLKVLENYIEKLK